MTRCSRVERNPIGSEALCSGRRQNKLWQRNSCSIFLLAGNFRKERIGRAWITLATILTDEPHDDAQALHDPLPLACRGSGWVCHRLPSRASRAGAPPHDLAADRGESLQPDRKPAHRPRVYLDPLNPLQVQASGRATAAVFACALLRQSSTAEQPWLLRHNHGAFAAVLPHFGSLLSQSEACARAQR